MLINNEEIIGVFLSNKKLINNEEVIGVFLSTKSCNLSEFPSVSSATQIRRTTIYNNQYSDRKTGLTQSFFLKHGIGHIVLKADGHYKLRLDCHSLVNKMFFIH